MKSIVSRPGALFLGLGIPCVEKNFTWRRGLRFGVKMQQYSLNLSTRASCCNMMEQLRREDRSASGMG